MQAGHRRKICIGIAGVLPALAVILLVLKFARPLFSFIALPPDITGDRLAFAVRCMVLPGAALLMGIVFASRRGFDPDAIDGTRRPAHHGLEINLRYNLNTLEQTVLAGIAWSALALDLPADRLWLLPAMATLFLLGRMTFWVGYLLHPMGRAFGMALTVLPLLGCYAWLAWHAVH